MAETTIEGDPETTPFDLPETQAPAAFESQRALDLTGNLPEFIEVAVPYGADEYVCPKCEYSIPTFKQVNLSKPAKFAHRLNDVMKCPKCQFIFSYKVMIARVIRQ